MSLEYAMHHRLDPADQPRALQLAMAIKPALEDGRPCHLVTPDGVSIELPGAIAQALLDLASMLAIEPNASVVLLGSEHRLTKGAFDLMLHYYTTAPDLGGLPAPHVGTRKNFTAAQLIDAVLKAPGRAKGDDRKFLAAADRGAT